MIQESRASWTARLDSGIDVKDSKFIKEDQEFMLFQIVKA